MSAPERRRVLECALWMRRALLGSVGSGIAPGTYLLLKQYFLPDEEVQAGLSLEGQAGLSQRSQRAPLQGDMKQECGLVESSGRSLEDRVSTLGTLPG